MSEINPQATVEVRARMSGTVIRGASGEHGAPGSREPVEFSGDSAVQLIEVNHATAVELFGQEKADELFRDVVEGGDFDE